MGTLPGESARGGLPMMAYPSEYTAAASTNMVLSYGNEHCTADTTSNYVPVKKANCYDYDYTFEPEPIPDLQYLYRAPHPRRAVTKPIFHRRSDPRWRAGRWRSNT